MFVSNKNTMHIKNTVDGEQQIPEISRIHANLNRKFTNGNNCWKFNADMSNQAWASLQRPRHDELLINDSKWIA